MVYYLNVKCIILFAPDGHGTRFSARWRSEGIVSRATGGVVWTILVFVQNDREKKNNHS